MDSLASALLEIANYVASLRELQSVAFMFFLVLWAKLYFDDKKLFYVVVACVLLIPILINELIDARLFSVVAYLCRKIIQQFFMGGFIGAVPGYLLADYIRCRVTENVKYSLAGLFVVTIFSFWCFEIWERMTEYGYTFLEAL